MDKVMILGYQHLCQTGASNLSLKIGIKTDIRIFGRSLWHFISFNYDCDSDHQDTVHLDLDHMEKRDIFLGTGNDKRWVEIQELSALLWNFFQPRRTNTLCTAGPDPTKNWERWLWRVTSICSILLCIILLLMSLDIIILAGCPVLPRLENADRFHAAG